MTNKTAAIRYARALLDVAVKEKADLELIENELTQFADLLAQAKFTPIVSKLVALLADRDRLVLVPELLKAYSDRLLDYRGVVRAEVTTAVALDPRRADAIQKGLASLTGRSILLATKIDPSIIGGLVARIGSTVYDGSVIRQLEKMKERLVESV